MANTVVGLFDDVDEAQRAVEDLTYAGFTHDDVHVLGRDSLRNAPLLRNALQDGGIPPEDADYYAESLRRGSVLIAVLAEEDRVPEARDLIEQHHPADIGQRAAYFRATGYQGFDESLPSYTDGEAKADRESLRMFTDIYADSAENGNGMAASSPNGISPGYEQSYVPRAPAGISEANTPSYAQNYPAGDNSIGMSSHTSLTDASDMIGTSGQATAGGMNDMNASPGSRFPVSSERGWDADVAAVGASPVSGANGRTNGAAAGEAEAVGARPVMDSMTGNLETAEGRILREAREAHRARVGGPVDAGMDAYANSAPHNARVYSTLRNE